MKTKVLGWGASLAMTAVLGLAGSASAVIFATGDTLNEFGSLKLDNVNFGGLRSILFVPEIGGSGFEDPAEPGELAREFSAISGNTGAFVGFNGASPIASQIRSFNTSIDVNGFIPGAGGNTFIELPAAGPLASGALLALDQSSIQITEDPNVLGRFAFIASGRIQDVATGETVPILYDFTAQGLFADPANPGTTVIGSFSGTKITVVPPPQNVIPEPSSTLGLLTLGGFVVAGAIKQKKNSNLN